MLKTLFVLSCRVSCSWNVGINGKSQSAVPLRRTLPRLPGPSICSVPSVHRKSRGRRITGERKDGSIVRSKRKRKKRKDSEEDEGRVERRQKDEQRVAHVVLERAVFSVHGTRSVVSWDVNPGRSRRERRDVVREPEKPNDSSLPRFCGDSSHDPASRRVVSPTTTPWSNRVPAGSAYLFADWLALN